MENTLGFEEESLAEDEWPTGESVASLAALRVYQKQGDSREQLNQPNLVVKLQQRIHTDRPIIPATLMEKLAYYRAFTSSSSKIEMLCMQQNNVNRFTWFYISNALCKSLSMTYVYIFLSAYAPDHHLFVPKMVPIFYGLNWINVISAGFLLQTMSYDTALHFYYAIVGVIFKAPWNRCFQRILQMPGGLNYTCMELEEFAAQFVNKTITFDELFYVTPNGELFSVAQIEYIDSINSQMTYKELGFNCFFSVINILIWIIAAGLYNQLFKGYIWKILHYAQIALFALLLLIFFHLIVSYEDKEIQYIEAGESEAHRSILMSGDYDMLAETMTAPPVAHILSARTTSEIKPSLNSAVIVISNGVYYIFKALTSFLMKKHCERWVNASIIHWNFGSRSIFYFWPIYFATLNYGSVIAVIFFALNAIVDCCMFIITFQCLIEVVKYEWSWLKPWCLSVIMIVLAIIEITIHVNVDFSANSYIFYTSLSSLAEILIIFWIYPRGRFLDDITFHFGVPPTRLRRWTFCFLPWFYLWKVFIMLILFYTFTTTTTSFIFKALHTTRYAPTCIMILFAVGAVYAFYDHVLIGKRGFSQLFKPVPEWGPKDFRLRQLRKKFDSRQYIVSQAPRDLSRYLIEKSGLVSYQLDVVYDAVKPRSTVRGNGKDAREKEH
ncbi:uncharacterized protein LOC123864572 [Maniola jurtina]|uniref:uncharacterized protein LOC123864572 n=1 Tax=Maniola jurtina TaxID=191418 RepID=UPI001E68CED8|nr:uncharacterized protein LOC123864572 [Maniola jurtina]